MRRDGVERQLPQDRQPAGLTGRPGGPGHGPNPVPLRFWQWFGLFGLDNGVVRVSVFDETRCAWAAWADVGARCSGASGAWSLNIVDLTPNSGELVRIASVPRGSQWVHHTGWYLDDIAVGVAAPGTPTISEISDQTINLGLQRRQLPSRSATPRRPRTRSRSAAPHRTRPLCRPRASYSVAAERTARSPSRPRRARPGRQPSP